MPEEDFEKLVEKAITALPKHIQEKIENVAVIVKKNPSSHELRQLKSGSRGLLLGLYQGIPKTVWGRDSMAT